MGRPTVQDVAKAADVSIATVDRVLNRRGGVAAKSIEKVEAAVSRVGYVRDEAAAMMGAKRSFRFCFVLPVAGTGFAASLRDAVEVEAVKLAGSRVELNVFAVPAFDVQAQVAALRTINADAVAVMASEVPEVASEVARLVSEGVPVVTLVADIQGAPRACYVGPDNVRAGRTAAEFMGRFTAGSGRVLMIAGSLVARDHAERVLGFRRVMRERYPKISLLPEVEGGDDPARVEALVWAALRQGPLAGVYAIGAGNQGVLRALEAQSDRPVTIMHELTQTTRAGLATGAVDLVLDQDPQAEVARAVEILQRLAAGRDLPARAGETDMNIFIRENVR